MKSVESVRDKRMSEDWDILMKESSTGTWFQSEEAWRFYCACTEWMTPFHTEVRRGKRAVGMVTGYISKEKRAWKQRLSCRAIIFGGPLLAKDATIEEVKTLLRETEAEIQRLSEGRVIYIETRNFVDLSPWREAFEACGWEYRRHYDIHVDCRDGDALWQRIHESKRRAIKAADSLFFSVRSDSTSSETDAPQRRPSNPHPSRTGTQLFLRKSVCAPRASNDAGCPTDIDQWYSLLEELYKKKVHRPLWPKEFFEKAIEMNVGELLLVHDEGGKVIGGMFVVKDERRVYEWYVVGPVPATYAGLRYAVETGRETFDFMGAGEPGKPYGVRDFKMQFGGELKEPGRWIHICKKGYYRLGEIVYGILR